MQGFQNVGHSDYAKSGFASALAFRAESANSASKAGAYDYRKKDLWDVKRDMVVTHPVEYPYR